MRTVPSGRLFAILNGSQSSASLDDSRVRFRDEPDSPDVVREDIAGALGSPGVTSQPGRSTDELVDERCLFSTGSPRCALGVSDEAFALPLPFSLSLSSLASSVSVISMMSSGSGPWLSRRSCSSAGNAMG